MQRVRRDIQRSSNEGALQGAQLFKACPAWPPSRPPPPSLEKVTHAGAVNQQPQPSSALTLEPGLQEGTKLHREPSPPGASRGSRKAEERSQAPAQPRVCPLPTAVPGVPAAPRPTAPQTPGQIAERRQPCSRAPSVWPHPAVVTGRALRPARTEHPRAHTIVGQPSGCAILANRVS